LIWSEKSQMEYGNPCCPTVPYYDYRYGIVLRIRIRDLVNPESGMEKIGSATLMIMIFLKEKLNGGEGYVRAGVGGGDYKRTAKSN
jgi:hypothetical protein